MEFEMAFCIGEANFSPWTLPDPGSEFLSSPSPFLEFIFNPWQRRTLAHIEVGHPTALTACHGPTVLLAAKTYGSVFYDKLTPSIVRRKCSTIFGQIDAGMCAGARNH